MTPASGGALSAGALGGAEHAGKLVLRQFELELHNVRLEGQVQAPANWFRPTRSSDLASRDALTRATSIGALYRGALENGSTMAVSLCAVVMFDVDFFQKYNDTYGRH